MNIIIIKTFQKFIIKLQYQGCMNIPAPPMLYIKYIPLALLFIAPLKWSNNLYSMLVVIYVDVQKEYNKNVF